MNGNDVSEFILENVPHRSGISSGVLEFAARARGLSVERIDKLKLLISLPTGRVPFVGLNGPDISHVGRWFCEFRDKQRALLLRGGLPTVTSVRFTAGKHEDAKRYAASLGWPVTITVTGRPAGWGDARTAGSMDEFDSVWQWGLRRARKHGDGAGVFVERPAVGESFQLFVVDDQVVSVVKRPCVTVVGDGDADVSALIRLERARRLTHPYLRDHPIADNVVATDPRSGEIREPSYVPAADEPLTLRTSRGGCAGRDIVDVADIDPGFEKLAVQALSAMPGLAHGGVIISAATVKAGTYGAVECMVHAIDHAPLPLGHFPTHGESRDVAGAIIEHYLERPRWAAARSASHRGLDT